MFREGSKPFPLSPPPRQGRGRPRGPAGGTAGAGLPARLADGIILFGRVPNSSDR
jgi:hypothetical protein